MKKYVKYLVFLLVIGVMISYGLNTKKVNVRKKIYNDVTGTTEYLDWSSKTEGDSKYSYSNLFYTKNTTFEVLKSPAQATYSEVDGYILFNTLTIKNEGEEIWILIRNCG